MNSWMGAILAWTHPAITQAQDGDSQVGSSVLTGPKKALFYTVMEDEFAEAKSAANKAKHGLDFSQAQEMRQDVDAAEIPAKSDAEQRKMLIARMKGELARQSQIKAWLADKLKEAVQ